MHTSPDLRVNHLVSADRAYASFLFKYRPRGRLNNSGDRISTEIFTQEENDIIFKLEENRNMPHSLAFEIVCTRFVFQWKIWAVFLGPLVFDYTSAVPDELRILT